MSTDKERTKTTPWSDIPKIFLKWPFYQCIIMLILLAGIRLLSSRKSSISEDAYFYRCEALIKLVQDDLVFGPSFRFSLYTIERWCMLFLSLFGVAVNVVPKYLKNEGAERHIVQTKGTMILLIHILAGIGTVFGNCSIGIFGGYNEQPLVIWCLGVIDFVHQLSIFLLLKNHDGIWSMRYGNLALAILKFRTLINFNGSNGIHTSDIFFTASFGFMGTRLASFMFFISFYLFGANKRIQFEDFYSLGLSIAQLHIMIRIPEAERVFLWSLIPTSMWFYHEIWDIKFKPIFLLFNCIFAGLCLVFLENPVEIYCAIAFHYMLSYFLPRFHRFPKIALKEWIELTKDENAHWKKNLDENDEDINMMAKYRQMLIDRGNSYLD